MTPDARSRTLPAAALFAAALVLAASPARAIWPHDPAAGVAATGLTGETIAQVVSDGAGGSIVCFRSPGSGTLRAQRFDRDGNRLWGATGLIVYAGLGVRTDPVAVADGQGGVLLAWADNRAGNRDIYAQRVTSAGTLAWDPAGVAVCTATSDQEAPDLYRVADDTTFVLTWEDKRNVATTGTDVYAQRIGLSSVARWTANGVAVCTAAGNQVDPEIAANSLGNAYVVWTDQRADLGDLYGQQITLTTGAVSFGASGTPLVVAPNAQRLPIVELDASFGVYVSWLDGQDGTDRLYVRRFGLSLSPQWIGPLLLSGFGGAASTQDLIRDGEGGVFVAWADSRNAPSQGLDVYAQRVDGGGLALWTIDGVPLCTARGDQQTVRLARDGAGGLIAAWFDDRTFGSGDIYAARLDGTGLLRWGQFSNGAPVSKAADLQFEPFLCADGAGGAHVAWNDLRLHNTQQVYAQRIDEWGMLGAEPVITGVRDVPNDQGGQVRLTWNASALDTDPLFRSIGGYYIFRSVPAGIALRARREGRITADAAQAAASNGRILLEQRFGAQAYYWENIGFGGAYNLPNYSAVVPTTSDSVAGSNPLTAFMVMAVGGYYGQQWSSAPDSGYSTDDLAPAAPGPVSGVYAGGSAVLHWSANSEPDLASYRIYRGATPDFPADPAHQVGETPDTSFTYAAGAPAYYKVTAVDLHGNESAAALVLPLGTLGAPGAVGAPLALALPTPNPMRGHGLLRFALPAAGDAALEIYDCMGRRVRTLARGTFEPGRHEAAFDGRDDGGRRLVPGLYFARLVTPAGTRTVRLALAR